MPAARTDGLYLLSVSRRKESPHDRPRFAARGVGPELPEHGSDRPGRGGARSSLRQALQRGGNRLALAGGCGRHRPPDPRGPLATSTAATEKLSDEADDISLNFIVRTFQDELRHSPRAETVVVSKVLPQEAHGLFGRGIAEQRL